MTSSGPSSILTHPSHVKHSFRSLSSAEYTMFPLEFKPASTASSVSCWFPGMSSSNISLFAILVSVGTLLNIYIPLWASIAVLFDFAIHYGCLFLPDLAILATAHLLTRAYLVYWTYFSRIHEATKTARHLRLLLELERRYYHETLSQMKISISGVSNELQETFLEKKSLSRALEDAQNAMENTKRDYNENIEGMSERLQRSSERVANLENKGNNDVIEIKRCLNQLSLMTKANDDLASQYASASARNKHLSNQLNTVTREKGIIVSPFTDAVSVEIVHLLGQLKTITEEKRTITCKLNDSIAENKVLQREFQIILKTKDSINSQLLTASTVIENFQSQLKTVTEEKDDIIINLLNTSADNNSLQIHLNTATEEKDKAVSQLIDTASEIEGLMSHLSIASGQREYLTSQLADASAENKHLVSQVSIVLEERDYLTSQLGDASTENQILKDQTTSLAKLCATASSDHAYFMKALRKAQEQCVEAEERWAKAKEETRSLRNERSVLSQKLEERDSELFAVPLELISVDNENEHVTHSLSNPKAGLVNSTIVNEPVTQELNTKFEVKEAELHKQLDLDLHATVEGLPAENTNNLHVADTRMHSQEGVFPIQELVEVHQIQNASIASDEDVNVLCLCNQSASEHLIHSTVLPPTTSLPHFPEDRLVVGSMPEIDLYDSTVAKTTADSTASAVVKFSACRPPPCSSVNTEKITVEVMEPPERVRRSPPPPFSSTGLKIGDVDSHSGQIYSMEVAAEVMKWNWARVRHSKSNKPKPLFTVEEVMWELKQKGKIPSSPLEHGYWKLALVDMVPVVVPR